jgi:peptidoglycan/LPS O-acetylase OafA/YrhL
MTLLKEVDYRKDIDGLRGYAVLAVIFYHALPSVFPGGFIGVDIFFVISGFLITKIISSSLAASEFSFLDFYAKRMVRLAPALLITLTIVMIIGWLILLPDEYEQLGRHLFGGAAFIENFILYKEVSYFDISSERKILLHLWSLAIEEQFYLIWPLIIFLAFFKRISLRKISIIILLGSLLYGIWRIRLDPEAAFYFPQARIWEMMVGAFLAANEKITIKMVQKWGAVASLIIIILCIAYINRGFSYPGWAVFLPVIAAFLLIYTPSDAIGKDILFSNRLIVFFGLISYPLYLYHWPALAFIRVMGFDDSFNRIVVIILCIPFSWLTYLYIEKNFRLHLNKISMAKFLGLGLLIMGGIGLTIWQNKGFPERHPELSKISTALQWGYPGNLEEFNFKEGSFRQQKSNNSETVLFLGDSNVEQYYPRVDALIQAHPKIARSVIFSALGCSPIPNVSGINRGHCQKQLSLAADLVREQRNIKTVVMTAFWPNYLSDVANFYYIDNGVKRPIAVGNLAYKMALDNLSEYIQNLKKENIDVILILNIPSGQKLDPKMLVERSIFPPYLSLKKEFSMSESEINPEYAVIKQDLILIARNSNIQYIDPINYLCSEGYCSSVDKLGMPIYRDYAHLSPEFMRHVGLKFIDDIVLGSPKR